MVSVELSSYVQHLAMCTFQSRASASLASKAFFSSDTASDSVLSSFACAFSPSAGVSLASLYHRETAGWVALSENAGAVWNWGRRSALLADALDAVRRDRDEVEKAWRSIVK